MNASYYVSLNKKSLRIWASIALAAGLLIVSLVLMGRPAQAEPMAGSISGAITYNDDVLGNQTVVAIVFTSTTPSLPMTVTQRSGPGSYTFAPASLPNDTYYVQGVVDYPPPGPGGGDLTAWYDPEEDGVPNPVVVEDGAVTGIDIYVGGPWTPTGGPMTSEGQVNDLAVRPQVSGTLYAVVGTPDNGTNTKIYTTTDGAANWTAVYTSSGEKHNAVAVTGTLAYAVGQGGSSQDLIVKSDDGGVSWTQVFTGASGYDQHWFSAVAINPVTPTTVYAAGVEQDQSGNYTGVVYESLNGGANWTRALTESAGCCAASFYALAINPVTPTTVYAAGYGSDSNRYRVIYRYDGANWTRVYSQTMDDAGYLFNSLLVHPLTPTTVYAGTPWGDGYLYRSMNEGATWNRVLTDTAGRLLAFDPPNTVYAIGGCDNVYSSTVGGSAGTWGQGESPDDCIQSLAIDLAPTPSALYAGTDNMGVYKSGSWVQRNNGFQTTAPPRDIEVDPQNLDKLFVAADCKGGWMTIDGGQTYSQPLGIAGCMGAFAINPEDSDVVYGGAYDNSRGAVLRSEDGGLSFTPVYTASFIQPDGSGGSESIYAVAIASSMTSTVYAAGADYLPPGGWPFAMVVRSQDDGASWTKVLTLTQGSEIETLAVDPTDADTVYAGGDENGSSNGFIRRTDDGGETWTKVFTPSQNVRDIVVDPQKPNIVYASDDGYRVYKSADGGDTWDAVRRPPWEGGDLSGNQLAIDPHVPSHVYLGGSDYIAESSDGGQTWSEGGDPINQGTSGMPQALAVDNGTVTQTLYAGFNGLWYYRRATPQPGAPVTVTASSSVSSTQAGETVTVSSLVVDQHVNWVSDGTVVTFTTSPEGSFASSWVTKTTADGRTEATLTGVTSGTASITVTSGSGMDTLSVDFTPFRIYLPLVLCNS